MSTASNSQPEWQVAPAEFEINHYDEPQIRYRIFAEEFVKPLTDKSLRKKTFYTISTNVLCADIHSSKDTIDPIDRDLYLPLEIALTKWSLNDAKEDILDRELASKCWILNPGPPTRSSNSIAMLHSENHKIPVTLDKKQTDEEYDETLVEKSVVWREINSFLSADRTVFSISLRNCRQDLGCLKWLNKQCGQSSKPIKVLNLLDLYVVLTKRLCPNFPCGIGVAHFRLNNNYGLLEQNFMCQFHKSKAENEEEGGTPNCAKEISLGYSNVLIDDLQTYSTITNEESQ